MDNERDNEEAKPTEEADIVGSDVLEGELVEPQKQQNIFVRFVKGMGTGGMYVGGGVLFILFQIVQFAIPAVVGLLMIWWAISSFMDGSILVGLLVLLIGTPIAIGLSHWLAIYVFFLAILAFIIWGISSLFGVGLSFDNAWDIGSLIVKVVIVGGLGYFLVTMLVDAIRSKTVGNFLKETWFYILIFCLLFWWFFL